MSRCRKLPCGYKLGMPEGLWDFQNSGKHSSPLPLKPLWEKLKAWLPEIEKMIWGDSITTTLGYMEVTSVSQGVMSFIPIIDCYIESVCYLWHIFMFHLKSLLDWPCNHRKCCCNDGATTPFQIALSNGSHLYNCERMVAMCSASSCHSLGKIIINLWLEYSKLIQFLYVLSLMY
jgi:hypothetical protein